MYQFSVPLAVVNAFKAHELEDISSAINSVLKVCQLFIENGDRHSLGDNFNPFLALTRHHLEELHSRQLYYLLNPASSHNCGALFLHSFVNLALEIEALTELPYAYERAELSRSKVYREHLIGWSSQTNDYGKIDILIETEKHLIAIENKIFASEQPTQLQRYYNYCTLKKGNSEKKVLVIFLTIEGEKSKDETFNNYTSISYRENIVFWLKELIQTTLGIGRVSDGLYFYLDQLQVQILKTKSLNDMSKLKNFLLAKENLHLLKELNIEEIEQLSLSLDEVRKDLRVDFFKKVFIELTSLGFKVQAVHRLTKQIDVVDIWDRPDSGIRIENEELSLKLPDGRTALFCIEHHQEGLWIGLFPFKNDGSWQADGLNKEKFSMVQPIIKNLEKEISTLFEIPDDGWFAWEYFIFRDQLDFGSDKLNYDLATDMDNVVRAFTKQVSRYLDAFKKVKKLLERDPEYIASGYLND